MRQVFFLLFLLAFGMPVQAQTSLQQLYDAWPEYREPAITQRRFSPDTLHALLQPYAQKEGWSLTDAGKSVEGRPISLIRYGQGPVKVLLWSQMHGDEPTATAALLDIFRFLASDDDFAELRQMLADSLSLYFLPMLNPDGAARFQRRNALDIDLNRDALALQSPESRLLKNVRDRLQADWGFNLHDQNRGYAAGPEGPPASITLLAPPLDRHDSVNTSFSEAMQLTVQLYDDLQSLLPGAVGRWSDAFEPRAFGENMQRWGTRTVLIESGGKPGDSERQEVRRANFAAILQALAHIAQGSYAQADTSRYKSIPLNEKRWLDLLITNAELKQAGYSFSSDLGILREEEEAVDGRFYVEGEISEFGDLRTFGGYETFDARGLQLVPARLYPQRFPSLADIPENKANELLRQGFTGIIIESLPDSLHYSPYRLNLHTYAALPDKPGFEAPADFVLMQDKEVIAVVINGFLYALNEQDLAEGQGRIIRK